MSRNKNVKRVAKRVFVAPASGDPGPPLPRPQYKALPAVDLDALGTRQLMQLALASGLDVKDVCGIGKCMDHFRMKKVGESFHLSKDYTKYVPGVDLLWCKQCWQWVREKKPLELADDE